MKNYDKYITIIKTPSNLKKLIIPKDVIKMKSNFTTELLKDKTIINDMSKYLKNFDYLKLIIYLLDEKNNYHFDKINAIYFEDKLIDVIIENSNETLNGIALVIKYKNILSQNNNNKDINISTFNPLLLAIPILFQILPNVYMNLNSGSEPGYHSGYATMLTIILMTGFVVFLYLTIISPRLAKKTI